MFTGNEATCAEEFLAPGKNWCRGNECLFFFFFFLNDTLYSAEGWKMGQGGIVLRLRWGCTIVI